MALSWAITKLIKGEPEEEWQNPSLKDPEGKTVLYSILGMLAINLCFTLITVYTLLRKVHCRTGSSLNGVGKRNVRTPMPTRDSVSQNKSYSRASTEKTMELAELQQTVQSSGPTGVHDECKTGFPARSGVASTSVMRYFTAYGKHDSFEQDEQHSSRLPNVVDTTADPQTDSFVSSNGYRKSPKALSSMQTRRTGESSFRNTGSLFEPW
ncbi:unnamed protein product [Echinostoma caproni]|uniref:Uncharacterized protein n=1 Tax=Echinostoma caproni TaxID=27848 RepID=A0A183AUL5_9TREM|nr:unnamed protein product [Echinostoma caproni]